MIADTIEQAIDALEKELERKPKRIFNLGDGEYGRLIKINYFKHVDGIDTLEFEPVHNGLYRETRRKLGDDYVCTITDWIPLLKQIS